MKYYLAIDIGASSGRHIVGWQENGEIKTNEVYRFPNGVREENGHLVWDVRKLFTNVVMGIMEAFKAYPEIESLSIDTWGVDYVLLKGDEEVYPVYAYYLAQNTDTTYTKSLQKALAETEKSVSNLLRAIEAGIFNSSTKERLDELEDQKMELKSALAAAKLKEDLGLKKKHIVFFLHQFAGMDYSDVACQKRLIKTFVNSVFVYDDKVVLTFNYSGDNRTMTLKEIDAGLQQGVRIPETNAYQRRIIRTTLLGSDYFYTLIDSNNEMRRG